MTARRSLSLLAGLLASGVAFAQTATPTATPTVAPVTASPATASPATAAEAKRPGDIGQRWRINLERSSKSDGQLRFLVWQYDEDKPHEVIIPVHKGDTPNHLAVEGRDIFRDVLGTKDFEINTAKGNILITAKHGERRFGLQLAESTAEGVDVDLYREGR
jgi:hypothetical protein